MASAARDAKPTQRFASERSQLFGPVTAIARRIFELASRAKTVLLEG